MALTIYPARISVTSIVLTDAVNAEVSFGALAADKRSEDDSFVATIRQFPFSFDLSLFVSCQLGVSDRSTIPVPYSLYP